MATRRRSRARPEADDRWLSVGQAARLLGVGPATVRRWGDAGRLRVFVTPGGHRRFLASELTGIVSRAAGLPERFSADELDAIWSARGSRAARDARSLGWFQAFSDDERQHARDQGQALVRLAADYVANPDRREPLIADIQTQAAEYGEQAARIGVSLRNLMEAFAHFRRPLFAAVESDQGAGWQSARDSARQDSSAVLDLAEFLDRFTIHMVEAYVDAVLHPLIAHHAHGRQADGTGLRPTDRLSGTKRPRH